MEEFKAALRKFSEFSGRATRREYWMFFLVNVVIASVLDLLGLRTIGFLYTLFIFVPSLAVGIRRLHDTGKSGKWFLVLLLPILGAIWLLVLLAMPGDMGENQYGEEPQPIL
jgi:uncharacterized membrane protein YhaH (DUF805 family)